jgi:two-component system NarL family sensor kinase
MGMDSTHDTRLFTALEHLAPHDHLCSIYESQEEQFAVAMPFIRIGIERGEKCIYICGSEAESAVQEAMYTEGIDVHRAIEDNALVLKTQEAVYLKGGAFDPNWMLTFWDNAMAEARRQGFSAVRLTGETEWIVRGAAGLERWMEYESRLRHILVRYDCRALCQYNRALFPPQVILDVIRTHQTVIYRGVVCRNMFYAPPDDFLDPCHATHEVERLLNSIREREEVEQTLRDQRDELGESERLLRLVLDALPVGVAVVDRTGDVILSNPESQRIWGRSIQSGKERYAASRAWSHTTGQRLSPGDWASSRALMHGEPTVNEVLDIESFDGVHRTIQNSAVPIRNTNDRITGAVVVNEEISARVAAERELSDSYRQMRALTGRLMRAQDDERRRIAQMLHETTAQDLAALKMQLSRLDRTVELNETDRGALLESISLAEQSMTEIRTLSYLLHPPFLDEMGLISALRWYAAGFTERSGIMVTLALPETFIRPPLDTETALFRIVQESLINIHRHSASKTASIRLEVDTETLVLAIEDRGHGIPSASLAQIIRGEGSIGVGIAGMYERIEQLGGSMEITSGDHGTTVRAQLPLMKRGD